MSNNKALYDKLKDRGDALNNEWHALNNTSETAVEKWNDDLEILKADIANSGLKDDDQNELYRLLGLRNSQNSSEQSYVASQRKTRRTRKLRLTRKARKARKVRKTKKAKKTRNQ
jgi:hypothetical protein